MEIEDLKHLCISNLILVILNKNNTDILRKCAEIELRKRIRNFGCEYDDFLHIDDKVIKERGLNINNYLISPNVDMQQLMETYFLYAKDTHYYANGLLFSEKLLCNKLDFKIEFFSEIDKFVIKSYCAIHNIDEKLNLGNILEIKGENLPFCDIWIGGFPCQDISCAGKMRGFDFESATRSSLGWEMIRLLKEVSIKPQYVIFENVASITYKNYKKTLDLFKKDLENLGYNLFENVLAANDYGIPQLRKRYFLIAILDNNKKIEFPKEIENQIILRDFLDSVVDEKYYLTNEEYIEKDNKLIFKNKNRDDIFYEVDKDKYLSGGLCGKDKHCKFEQSSRLFSELGYSPTITATNTAENCKIVVEGVDIK